MSNVTIYTTYNDFVKNVVMLKDLSYFKSHPSYTYMLEHVSYSFGKDYISLIKSEFNIDTKKIQNFCKLNDRIGSPNKYYFEDISMYTSPTSLRYIYHALLILKHINETKNTNIVELGCGYGGLCLAINFFNTNRIDSYTCIDLPDIIELQKLYLSNFDISFPINFISSETYGENIQNDNVFLISNYCFSEISSYNQKKYIDILFPKITHGFITWNNIPLYNFGKELIKVETERPVTGSTNGNSNLFVFF